MQELVDVFWGWRLHVGWRIIIHVIRSHRTPIPQGGDLWPNLQFIIFPLGGNPWTNLDHEGQHLVSQIWVRTCTQGGVLPFHHRRG